ncbi:MAG: hypothetical protein LLF76_10890 [Planctomycetaceae bacterium]|nr:hypothetical protein [Planctomycetaceae bacterium]
MESESISNAIIGYRILREEVDRLAQDLERMHSRQLACKKGCCDCCLNLSVWPVEFFSILDELRKDNDRAVAFNEAASCGYLCQQECIIYPYRPIICRTHGLPLVYWHEELDPAGYGVMFCKKNFIDSDNAAFGPDNTICMDEINTQLARLNIEFVSQLQEPDFSPQTRIELKQLVEYL